MAARAGMREDEGHAAASAVLAACAARGLTIVTAESCTGGMIAAALTAVPGASTVVRGGFVTYDNGLKTAVLGVDAAVIARDGAVSEAVARAMATGALRVGGADLAVAVTGIAGPGGGSADKPVGLVWLAACRQGGAVTTRREVFAGDRRAVRRATVARALELLGTLTQ